MLAVPQVVIEIARVERIGVGGKETAVLPRYFDVVAREDGGTPHVSLRYVGYTHYAWAHAEGLARPLCEEATSSAAAHEIMARFLEDALTRAVRTGEVKRVTFYAPPSSVCEHEFLCYTPYTATLDVLPAHLPKGTAAFAEFRAADQARAHAFLVAALRDLNGDALLLQTYAPCVEGVDVRIMARPSRPTVLDNALAFVRTFQEGAQFRIGAGMWRVTSTNANLVLPEATLIPAP